VQGSGIKPHIDHSPALVHVHLENVAHQIALGGYIERNFFSGDLVVSDNGLHFVRRREIVYDGVYQRLYTLVLQRGPAEHRDGLVVEGDVPYGLSDSLLIRSIPGQVSLHDFVIIVGQFLEQMVSGGFRFFQDDVGNGKNLEGRPEAVFVPDEKPPFDEIHHTPEGVPLEIGNLQQQGFYLEPLVHLPDNGIEVRPQAVELIDESNRRHPVASALLPYGFGLGLDPSHSAEDHHRAVQHAQRPLHLDSEINMPGGVDDMDLMVFPRAGGYRRGDCNPPLLFLGHPVHGRLPVVDLAHPVYLSGVVEYALGHRGLARVDVGDESHVSYL